MMRAGPVAGRAARRSPPGFTLVEILIVVTLLVTLSAVLAPVLMPSPTRVLRESAGEVATQLRETRRQAQAQQARARFLVDTGTGQFGIAGSAKWHELPEDVAVQLTTGRSLQTGDTRGGIDFFPDGSSTGGRISLSSAGRRLDVDIEWLTGRIRIDEGEP